MSHESTAYDPVRNETVSISNCYTDKPHTFEIDEAVRNYPEKAKSHPRLLSSEYGHDAHDGCHGSHTVIVDEDCEYCGYDRANFTSPDIGGEPITRCRRCNAVLGSGYGDEGLPKQDSERARELKEWAENPDYTPELVGKIGGPHQRRSTKTIVNYPDSRLIKIITGDKIDSFRTDFLLDLVLLLADNDVFENDDGITAEKWATLSYELMPSDTFDEINEIGHSGRMDAACVLLALMTDRMIEDLNEFYTENDDE